MLDYGFTEEQIMVRELVRKIALEKVLPVRAELDEKGIFPKDILKVLSDADL